MRKLFPLMLIFILPYSHATSPGTSNVAARITDFGDEFGYGMMISSAQMFLINVSGQFSHSALANKYQSIEQQGPDTTRYEVHLYPELRFYSRPKSKTSPFLGLYAHLGYGGSIREIVGNQDAGVTESQLTLGVGLSTGAEVFLSSYLSLAVSARWLNYTFENKIHVQDTGTAETTTTNQQHKFNIRMNPAVYLRLHF